MYHGHGNGPKSTRPADSLGAWVQLRCYPLYGTRYIPVPVVRYPVYGTRYPAPVSISIYSNFTFIWNGGGCWPIRTKITLLLMPYTKFPILDFTLIWNGALHEKELFEYHGTRVTGTWTGTDTGSCTHTRSRLHPTISILNLLSYC